MPLVGKLTRKTVAIFSAARCRSRLRSASIRRRYFRFKTLHFPLQRGRYTPWVKLKFKIEPADPGIEDMALTVLELFEVERPDWMEGRPVLNVA